MATAQIFPRIVDQSHVGASVIAEAEFGSIAGLVLGFAAGVWLILRDEGRWAGSALTWLWVGVLLILGCLGFVAFS